jgi:hypothetical protein
VSVARDVCDRWPLPAAPPSRMPVDRAGRLPVLSIEVGEEFDLLLARAEADRRMYPYKGQPGNRPT